MDHKGNFTPEKEAIMTSTITIRKHTEVADRTSAPMKADEHRNMAQVESRLWWYKALHMKVLQVLQRVSLPKSSPILDAGCGTGGLLSVLSDAGYSNISGFDISETAAAICQERGITIEKIGCQDIGKCYRDNSFSAIVSSDVLCYLTPQEVPDVLRAFHTALSPGGYLILNLPAYKAFAGIHDLSVGIVNRTTARIIRQQLADAGFTVTELHHWPFLLAPMIFLTRLKQRFMLQNNHDCIIKSDITLPSPLVNRLLLTLTTTEKLLGTRRFWGSSVFIFAQKK